MRGSVKALVCALLLGPAMGRQVCAQDGAFASDSSPASKLLFPFENGGSLEIGGVLRAYFSDDQRIAWSGVENTFGGQGVLRSLFTMPEGDWTIRARSEFFLNEPSGGTVLRDPVRDLYVDDYILRPFEVFQLALEVEHGDWLFRAGKIRSPFGSDVVPMFTNSLMDAPFLRTDIIGFTESGIFLRWHPGPWSFDLGLSNGEENLDTNSSKALIARIGLEQPNWSIAAWGKFQDGIGSEELKRFNSFVGLDASARAGSWTIYGEATVDQHGLYRNPSSGGFSPWEFNNLSLYGLDVHRAFEKPIYGVGFDVGAVYRYSRLMLNWNYGVYFPQQIGIPTQDARIERGLLKCSWDLTRRFQFFSALIFENSRPQPYTIMYNYAPRALIAGFQFGF